MDNKASSIGLSYGLISGLILVVFSLILYVSGVEAFMSSVSYISYLIIITIAVLAGLKQKKLNGGYLQFGEALKVVFTVFAIGFLLHTVFMFILLNYVDVSFAEALNQASLEKSEQIMRQFGASDSDIDNAMEAARRKNSFSFGNQMLGYGFMCIFFFIISLIIAAIIKKKQPEFDNSFNQQ